MPETARPVVLIGHPALSPRRGPLEKMGCRVVDRAGLTDADRAEVQVIFHMGETGVEPAFLATLPKLSLIAYLSAGYDGLDLAWCRQHGIAVTHARSINADDVADVAIGLMINAWRRLGLAERMVRDGRWFAGQRPAFGPSLGGRKLGVVGLGAIGEAVARRAQAFNLQVSWWGPRPKPAAPWPRAESLLALAADSDILVVATRAEADNRGMISQAVIEGLGPKGLLVNVARGSVVDEAALQAALRDGRLGAAGLDVFAQEPTPPELWADLDNVALAPHLAGGTLDSVREMTNQVLENIRRQLAGEPLLSPVQD